MKDGQKDLARQQAEKALAILVTPGAPASSWTNTEPYRGEIRRGATKVLQQVGATAPSSQAPGDSLRDCPECPEMVVIPVGHFTMGSSDAEKNWAASHGGSRKAVADEAPQHEVTLASFALGKYDVTRGEYATFVRATGRSSGGGCGHDSFKWDKDPNLSWEDPGFTQSDRDPVVCVSWNDAQAYVSWLSGKTGHGYRLPTEAESEYAARGGTTTKFWWGDDDGAAPVHAWFKDNSDGQTHPVGGKPSNGFGLYDMVGNVWQWTLDCYAESYTGAPNDGRAKEGRSDCLRVDRGGSWMYPAWLLRPATRERNRADFRDRIMGFRVARSLP
jgi:formylglycine-generating enzyme required for sulfatase activity